MPELPEVETVCRGLRQHIIGRRIIEVDIRRSAMRIPIPDDFAERVSGATITAVGRRAKYILIYMDNGYVILGHLGMSGKMLVTRDVPEEPAKHDHVLFFLEGGVTVIFNDPRRFGLITGCSCDVLHEHPLLKMLGVEPLSADFNVEHLFRKAQGSRKPVKNLIMDQAIVVGVGNIYAAEALFSAGILPDRSANTINNNEVKQLVACIKCVLLSAIESGGSTLRDYVRSDGRAGYFQHNFAVYGREGKSCVRCGQVVRRMVQAGRSTFYCGSCQK